MIFYPLNAMRYLTLSFIACIAFLSSFGVAAQETNDSINTLTNNDVIVEDQLINEGPEVMIPPLFEYIEAPDDLPDLQSRTDYLVENFWRPFDFKTDRAIDQNALNHAFNTYMVLMKYSSEKKAMESIRKLIGNLKASPILSLQFTKAAEENLYGPRAEFWVDDIYLSFIDNLLANKKIPESKKKRYKEQKSLLTSNAIGAVIPEFKFHSLDDKPDGLSPTRDYTLIELATPDCDDCRYSNLKLDISSVINDMILDGNLDVFIIYPEEHRQHPASIQFPDKWRVGTSDGAFEVLDIRINPSFFIIDKNKKIIAKNLSIDGAIKHLESLK